MADIEWAVRLAAFEFLKRQVALSGDGALTWPVLQRGFEFQGERVPLVSMQGIFKPAILQLPLSIRTAPVELGKPRPYEDDFGRDGIIHYRYRGTDPQHPENAGLRKLRERGLPLLYLFGLVREPVLYHAVFPVVIAGDDPGQLTFLVQATEAAALSPAASGEGLVAEGGADRRRYLTSAVQVRVHQQSFRLRVLKAYRESCTICHLRRPQLLDAAHILPDTHERGFPEVYNGLSLCKLHHAAYDSDLLGIRPELTVDVRLDILEETDGPMLQALKAAHGQAIHVPRQPSLQPNPDHLAERFERYQKAI